MRADAVQAAIRKSRDYAAALGETLRSVEHIADAALLSDSSQFGSTGARVTGRAASRSAQAPDALSLDPVPQELAAVIEARFNAVALGSRAMAECGQRNGPWRTAIKPVPDQAILVG